MTKDTGILVNDALELLKALIGIPSFSREEDGTAGIIGEFFRKHGVPMKRQGNNIWCCNQYFDASKPTILLNSHHDTVRPNAQYTKDPFKALVEDGKLFGLGSNDAGGSLVSLIATFLHYNSRKDLRYNLIMAATAEEEISGPNGIESLLNDAEFNEVIEHKTNIAFAIVGEPTLMQMAIAERGLMVLDCMTQGKAGHAARNEGENAVYKAIPDIEWFRSFRFPRHSALLGPVQMSVTVIETPNKAHNMVPEQCKFVVDTRVNELYTFEEVLETIKVHTNCELKPRSTRLRSTSIPQDHPIVKAGLSLGRSCYGSPTTSDKALMPFPALKIGPGDSARSHTADEFIYITEIKEGIELYIALLDQVV